MRMPGIFFVADLFKIITPTSSPTSPTAGLVKGANARQMSVSAEQAFILGSYLLHTMKDTQLAAVQVHCHSLQTLNNAFVLASSGKKYLSAGCSVAVQPSPWTKVCQCPFVWVAYPTAEYILGAVFVNDVNYHGPIVELESITFKSTAVNGLTVSGVPLTHSSPWLCGRWGASNNDIDV